MTDGAYEIAFLSGTPGAKGDVASALRAVFAQVRPGDYVAITAYVARNAAHAGLLDRAREAIRDGLHVATTVGFGPRFLHSTGQLHKGGPPSVVALQIVADEPDDPAIPGMKVGFRTLLAAQALGDWRSLDARKRRGARVHISGSIESGLAGLSDAIVDALAVRT